MTLEALMLDEARRNLTRQEANLDGLRTRTTAVLSVSAIVFAILGEPQIKDPDAWTWLAVGSFILSALMAVFILLPRDFHFGMRVYEWMGEIDRKKADSAIAAWDAAEALAQMQVVNKTTIVNLTGWYAAQIGLLVAQVTFLVIGGID